MTPSSGPLVDCLVISHNLCEPVLLFQPLSQRAVSIVRQQCCHQAQALGVSTAISLGLPRRAFVTVFDCAMLTSRLPQDWALLHEPLLHSRATRPAGEWWHSTAEGMSG